MKKLGIFAWFSYSLPMAERFCLIKETGFDAVSLWWGDKNKERYPALARSMGFEIDNIHAPFQNANSLWIDREEGEEYLHMLMDCVKDCNQYQIPTVVIHATGFSDLPPVTSVGMGRIQRLVETAEQYKVRLAFENLNGLDHLDAILKTFDSDFVGFCYDSGHENCYHRDADCLSQYGNRLFAIHLDDNFGDHDTHLLPFDGNADWNRIKDSLSKNCTLDFLTLEVDFNPKHEKSQIYQELSAAEYLARAYESVIKVAQ